MRRAASALLRRIHPLTASRLDRRHIDWLGLAACFTLNQGLPERGKLFLGLLVLSDEMADILTVIPELAAFDPAFYPAVLLFGEGDGFPVHAHSGYSWAQEV